MGKHIDISLEEKLKLVEVSYGYKTTTDAAISFGFNRTTLEEWKRAESIKRTQNYSDLDKTKCAEQVTNYGTWNLASQNLKLYMGVLKKWCGDYECAGPNPKLAPGFLKNLTKTHKQTLHTGNKRINDQGITLEHISRMFKDDLSDKLIMKLTKLNQEELERFKKEIERVA